MTAERSNWIGSTINQMRREQKLTQEALANQAGVTRHVVMNLELGASRSWDSVERVLDALGYELEVVKK